MSTLALIHHCGVDDAQGELQLVVLAIEERADHLFRIALVRHTGDAVACGRNHSTHVDIPTETFRVGVVKDCTMCFYNSALNTSWPLITYDPMLTGPNIQG